MDILLKAKMDYLENDEDIFITNKKGKWYYGSKYKKGGPYPTKSSCVESAIEHKQEILKGIYNEHN